MIEALYFGCGRDGQLGHYLWRADGGPLTLRHPAKFLERQLDGLYPPQTGPQVQGQALRHHVHGWTVVAWWDRTVDHRGASNSAVLIRGEYDFEGAMIWARRLVPWLFERIPFEIVNADAANERTTDAQVRRLVEEKLRLSEEIQRLILLDAERVGYISGLRERLEAMRTASNPLDSPP